MTRDELINEVREVERDHAAFIDARDVLYRRIREMDGTPRQEMFTTWAVTQVILNSFILAIVRCEGLIQDYRKLLETMDAPDNVVQLTCIKGDQDDPSGK